MTNFYYLFPNKVVVGETEMPNRKYWSNDIHYKEGFDAWLSTAKSYPIADKENEQEFINTARIIWANTFSNNEFFQVALNQGILIPAENVRLDCNCDKTLSECSGKFAYFIPTTPLSTAIEESTEGQQDELRRKFKDWFINTEHSGAYETIPDQIFDWFKNNIINLKNK